MSDAEIRVEKGREAVQMCMECQEAYKKRNPYDMTLSGLREQCWTCANAHKNKANDPKEHRGRVGGYQPW